MSHVRPVLDSPANPALEGALHPLFGNIVACHVLDRHARHPVSRH
ncbi:hypothetical protein GZL_00131 [Streptomyces sp. 769]|nr:hypothetical protein GZL_00131 [Streptomyces sp. 769]